MTAATSPSLFLRTFEPPMGKLLAGGIEQRRGRPRRPDDRPSLDARRPPSTHASAETASDG